MARPPIPEMTAQGSPVPRIETTHGEARVPIVMIASTIMRMTLSMIVALITAMVPAMFIEMAVAAREITSEKVATK